MLLSADDYDTLIETVAYAFVPGPLLDEPRRVGKHLDPTLAPAWTARRGIYRILHLIDNAHRVVQVTAVRHRADAYGS